MNTERFERKLSAILSADVAGYSRLMGDDEEATVSTLTGYRKVNSTMINRHQGCVVDSTDENSQAELQLTLHYGKELADGSPRNCSGRSHW